MKPKLAIITTGLALACGAAAWAEGVEAHKVILPQAIKWEAAPGSLPAGSQLAVLDGDPTREGVFTMRIKTPKSYRIPPHTHSDLAVSSDAPTLDIAYRLTEYAGVGRMKLSTGKRSLPGRKQVFRQFRVGVATRDVIARYGESLPGVALLRPVMLSGRRVKSEVFELSQIRAHAEEALAALPSNLRTLRSHEAGFDVAINHELSEYERETRERRLLMRPG